MAKASVHLLRECSIGFIEHKGYVWKEQKDGIKRKVRNIPDVRYEPVESRGKDYKAIKQSSKGHI